MNDPRFEVVGVLTMPDAASWRGMKIKENIVWSYAKELWIAPEDIKKPHSLRSSSKKRSTEAVESYERLQEKQIDFLVVVAYWQILPKHILELPKIWPINVHGSLLPEYRGASPLQTVFLDEKKETGVTIMVMDEGVDTGDMIDKKNVALPLSWTVKDLVKRIENETPSFLCDTLWEYGKWRLDRVSQDHQETTNTKKISKNDGLIVLTDTLQDVYRKYQAYALWPKVFFEYNKRVCTIDSLEVDAKQRESMKHQSWVNDAMKLNDAITSCMVKPSWKKAMTRDSFINGYMK